MHDVGRGARGWTSVVRQQRASADRARRGIVDPRLLRYARATRTFIGASVGLGGVAALLVIAQAWLLATVIAGAFHGKDLRELRVALAALLAVALVRAIVAWGTELAAGRSAALAKRQLRAALLEHVVASAPSRAGDERAGATATLATGGLDALDAYYSLYLPQLLLAAIVPAAVIVALLAADWISAAIVAVTLPLIPVFMALVGATTRERTTSEMRILHRLAGHFLDVVAGLPTLKIFGAAKRQTQVLDEVGERHRVAAIATLRVTFLSSLVLELLSTISIALVAVEIGLRLLSGDLGLHTALFVLVLTPEAYLPLRALGANYHASAEGVASAERAFEVLETPLPERRGRAAVPDMSVVELSVEDLTVSYPGRAGAALAGVSLHMAPGEVVAVTGPSGSGKSTLLNVILGFTQPAAGSVWIGDLELGELDIDAWRRHVAWMPQRPWLSAGSIADNVRIARAEASDDEVRRAVHAAGLDDVVALRPDGIDSHVGDGGALMSAGERQRVALARLFLRDAPLLLLDEPTANLDGATEDEVLVALRRLIAGRTAIVVAHRPALVALADRVVDLGRVAVPA
jgi:thiol reductant ABC exporter CydD subunit